MDAINLATLGLFVTIANIGAVYGNDRQLNQEQFENVLTISQPLLPVGGRDETLYDHAEHDEVVFLDKACARNVSYADHLRVELLSEQRCFHENEVLPGIVGGQEYYHFYLQWNSSNAIDCANGVVIDFEAFCISFIEFEPVMTVADEGECRGTAIPNEDGTWFLDDFEGDTNDGIYSSPYFDDNNLIVYVVDTYTDLSHEHFDHIPDSKKKYLGTRNDPFANDHGTHVTGSIVGNKYGVIRDPAVMLRVCNACVLNADGTVGCASAWIEACLIAFHDDLESQQQGDSKKRGVINMSLRGAGCGRDYFDEIRNLKDIGGITVVAAGNDNADACNYSPACLGEVITVGAYDSTHTRAWFSNRGACIDAWGPGVNIRSSIANGGYANFPGTSMASPLIAGRVGQLLNNNPDMTLDEMKEELTDDDHSFAVADCQSTECRAYSIKCHELLEIDSRRNANAQCYVEETVYSGDRLDNPIFEGGGFIGTMTLADCLDQCASRSDSKGRPCVAVEWSDGGNVQSDSTTKSCALAWGCDYTKYWSGGSVFPMEHAEWNFNAQCYVEETEHNGDRLDNPIFEGGGFIGTMTLSECKLQCALRTDSRGRPCVAIEWSDGGSAQSDSTSKACALAWGCDYTKYWSGGSVYMQRDAPYKNLGCYRDTGSRALPYGPGGADITIGACHEWSIRNGYTYFAVQHGGGSSKGECRCSNSLSEATRYGLATNCEAGTGGSWANDLYRNLVSYQHVGCYQDTGSRALDYGPGGADITIEACHEWSVDNGYTYFALQHGEGSIKGECRCSNSLSESTQFGTATSCQAGTGWSWANDLYQNSLSNHPSAAAQAFPGMNHITDSLQDPMGSARPDFVDSEPTAWTLELTAKDLTILVLVVINVVILVALFFVCGPSKSCGTRHKYKVVSMAGDESDDVGLVQE